MTCIAALVDKGRVWLAGDSCGTRGSSVENIEHGKVWEVSSNCGTWLFGIAGTSRMIQLLQYESDFPNDFNDISPKGLIKALSREWIPEVHRRGKETGALEMKDGASKLPGSALIAHNSKLYILTPDLAITPLTESFASIGSGGDFARGVLCLLQSQKSKLSARDQLKSALTFASKHCAGVGGHIHILTA